MAKLLLLDDDKLALAWMCAALEDRGHEVTAVTTPRAALEALKVSTPDLIVADMLMPEIDGIAFAKLARDKRDIPLMFVSIAKRQTEAVLVGAVGYVQKPATAGEIRDAIDRVLGERPHRATVLIVDDDPDVCALYRAYLDGRFDVLTALNGKEALALLKERHVDLAIVDVHMPVMDGAELIRSVRRDPSLQALPVIVQTGDRSTIHAPIWRSLGVSKVLDKVRFVDWFEAQLHEASLPPSSPSTPKV